MGRRSGKGNSSCLPSAGQACLLPSPHSPLLPLPCPLPWPEGGVGEPEAAAQAGSPFRPGAHTPSSLCPEDLGEFQAPSGLPDPSLPGPLGPVPPAHLLLALCALLGLLLHTHWYLVFNTLEKFPPGPDVAQAPRERACLSPQTGHFLKVAAMCTPAWDLAWGGAVSPCGDPRDILSMACPLLPSLSTVAGRGSLGSLSWC